MELYRKFPVICTIWAFVEVVCFGGVIFGWGSLVFILKEEGFYLNLCTATTQSGRRTNSSDIPTLIVKEPLITDTLPQAKNSSSYIIDTSNTNDTVNEENENFKKLNLECKEQAAQLNLWFSVAVSFMYLSFTAIGYLTKKLGTRLTRCIFM